MDIVDEVIPVENEAAFDKEERLQRATDFSLAYPQEQQYMRQQSLRKDLRTKERISWCCFRIQEKDTCPHRFLQ